GGRELPFESAVGEFTVAPMGPKRLVLGFEDLPLVLAEDGAGLQAIRKRGVWDRQREVALHLEEVADREVALPPKQRNVGLLAVVLPGAQPAGFGPLLGGDLACSPLGPGENRAADTLSPEIGHDRAVELGLVVAAAHEPMG